MKTQEPMTAQDSLAIITSMIQEAKGNMKRNGFYFIFWGWVIVIANLGMFVLQQLEVAHPYAIWAITIPAWVLSLARGYRQTRSERTTTHLDTVAMWMWITFGITIFTLVAFGSKINYQLNPVILTISAIPTFLTGIMIRFRPLVFGGISLWCFGIAAFLLPAETQPLIGAVAVLCGYLIPGHLLQGKL